jgi:putative SOS response-associated peptidase YedK
MCGRFTPIPRPQVLETVQREFNIEVARSVGVEPATEMNLFGDGQCLPFRDVDTLYTGSDGKVVLGPMQWQLIHDWNREFQSEYTNFNTRFEKLGKAHNRDLLRQHRCIVPVAEFFENRQVDGRTVQPKESWRFTVKGQSIIPLGGIFSIWTNPEDGTDRRLSCSVITMEPNELIGEIHNRMPFIIPRDTVKRWLEREVDDFEDAMEMIKPFDAELMVRQREGGA